MHKILLRQLGRLGIDPQRGPADSQSWQDFLERVEKTYEQSDHDIYILERSIDVSSREMQALYRTLQEHSDSQLAQERNRLHAVIHSLGDGLCWLDAQGAILLANQVACELLDGSPEQIPGQSFPRLAGIDVGDFIHRIQAVLQSGVPFREEDHVFFTAAGRSFPVAYVINPVNAEHLPRDGGVVLVFRDISERKQVLEEMRHAKEAAEAGNRAKSEFLSRVSHELRTPLNAILGFAQLMESDPLDPLGADHRESLGEIIRAGHHLLQLINEILDLARVESGRIGISLEDVSVGEILADCLALIAPLAASYGIEVLPIQAELRDLYVSADHTRLKQVLLNVLANAVKYNRTAGQVDILVDSASLDQLSIGIRDTGVGISPQELEMIFEPFHRVEDGRQIEGTGIGLTISRRLMKLMHGEILVESTWGAGSTFWLQLQYGNRPQSSVEAGAEMAPEVAASSMQRYLALYIEDNPANLQLVVKILKRRPEIELLTAISAEQGLELAYRRRPDLVLLDINLPGMDGFQALEQLKAAPSTRAIPVVGLSANAQPCDIERAHQSGFHDYLTKPLEVNQLLRVIGTLLP